MNKENEHQQQQTFAMSALFEQKRRLTIAHPAADIAKVLDNMCRLIVESRGGKYQPMEEIGRIARWLEKPHRHGLLLIGNVGSGKTTIARAIREVINHLDIGRFIDDKGLMIAKGWIAYGNIKNESTNWMNEVSAVSLCKIANTDKFDRLKSSAALMIDDIGSEPEVVKVYGNEQSPVAELIDWRNDHQLLTIATSNLSTRTSLGVNQFTERYGDRTASRIAELFDVIIIRGQDHRQGDNC